jgi:hypothetical protein
LGLIRIHRSTEGSDRLRAQLQDRLDPDGLDGIISMHLIEGDPALSKPLTDKPAQSAPGAADWYILIDGTHVNAILAVLAARFAEPAGFRPATVIATGVYNLMWDLAKSDIPSLEPRT